jgi:hypothetical protein
VKCSSRLRYSCPHCQAHLERLGHTACGQPRQPFACLAIRGLPPSRPLSWDARAFRGVALSQATLPRRRAALSIPPTPGRRAPNWSGRPRDALGDRPRVSTESPVPLSSACRPPHTPVIRAHRRLPRHPISFTTRAIGGAGVAIWRGAQAADLVPVSLYRACQSSTTFTEFDVEFGAGSSTRNRCPSAVTS